MSDNPFNRRGASLADKLRFLQELQRQSEKGYAPPPRAEEKEICSRCNRWGKMKMAIWDKDKDWALGYCNSCYSDFEAGREWNNADRQKEMEDRYRRAYGRGQRTKFMFGDY